MAEVTVATNGSWHTAHVHARSAATGLVREYDIRWRTQQWQCCGAQPPIKFDHSHWPFWIDGSRGTVEDLTQQCGRCGKHHSANYTPKES